MQHSKIMEACDAVRLCCMCMNPQIVVLCRLAMMQSGQRPNELVVKKLSMLGCVALVLAHSVKDMQDKLRGYHAGRLLYSYLPLQSHALFLIDHALWLAPMPQDGKSEELKHC